MIDFKSYWSNNTLKKYGPKIKHLQKFERMYSVTVLTSTSLLRPPYTPAIPLQWAEFQYSYSNYEGK
jgi:hypothetical protein